MPLEATASTCGFLARSPFSAAPLAASASDSLFFLFFTRCEMFVVWLESETLKYPVLEKKFNTNHFYPAIKNSTKRSLVD